ncbi:hypothetical protein Hanom_Chr15g01397001 [Helianthus anomalus]
MGIELGSPLENPSHSTTRPLVVVALCCYVVPRGFNLHYVDWKLIPEIKLHLWCRKCEYLCLLR